MLNKLFLTSGRQIALGILAGLVSGASNVFLVSCIGLALGDPGGQGWTMAATFFALCVLTVVSRSVSIVSIVRASQELMFQTRLSVNRSLIRVPLETLDTLGKSEVLAILTQDISRFIRAAQLVPNIFIAAITIFACIGYLAWLSWEVCLLSVLFLVNGTLVFRLMERAPISKLRQARALTDGLYRAISSLIEGNKQLKLNQSQAENFLGQTVIPRGIQFRDRLVSALTHYAWVSNAGQSLFFILIGIVAFAVPNMVPLSEQAHSSSLVLLLYLIQPVSIIISTLPELREAGISLDQLHRLEQTLATEEARPTAIDPFQNNNPLHVRMTGASYAFPGIRDETPFSVGPIDLEIRSGELVFLVGGNGSGKTTLAMLMLGLLPPTTGCIEMNGVTVSPANLLHYRSRFSAVFADFHLFEHLNVSGDQAAVERAEHYIRRLDMADKVRIEDGRYSTLKLSAGQRRRLALVTAYLEDRPIYLFDEWTADQDPAFRQVFYTELLPMLKREGKAVIVITHDDRYFDQADRIVRLDRGSIAYDGMTHVSAATL